MSTKIVFISYSWDNDSHKDWVLNLANSLVTNGVDVLLDQYDLSAGKEMTFFMEKAITADKVLVILSPNYKLKADKREGGVGYEYSLLTKEYYDKEPDKSRIIPILRQGDDKISSPTFIQTRIYHDMRDDGKIDAKLFELIRLIVDKPLIKKPELGQLPNFDNKSIPDVDKTIIDFKKKEQLLLQKKSIIDSVKGTQLFATKSDEIIKQISGALENYKKNFGLHFHIKTSNQPPSITFTTVNFTFHFQADNMVSNSASEAYVKLNLFKGPIGFNDYAFDYWEKPEQIYSVKYKFDVDENMNPIFGKSDAPAIKLTAHDIATVAVRDLITNEIKHREGELE